MRVAPGDTLYGIAFRLGLDWRELARWNGIEAPYTIRPGDRLRVRPPPAEGEGGRRAAATRPLAVARARSAPRGPARAGTVRPGARRQPPGRRRAATGGRGGGTAWRRRALRPAARGRCGGTRSPGIPIRRSRRRRRRQGRDGARVGRRRGAWSRASAGAGPRRAS
ncbi:MAG: LysM peptidoglycan-binding domain-containing protein [Xanthomonadales bacterium]|nr:LysM peptidoglycan-binding domain-containing protein [Xanthomonadales bacterium]